MWCRRCGGKTKVKCTIQGETVDRFRVCLKCGYKFQTVEAATFDSIWKEHCKTAYSNSKLEHIKEELSAKETFETDNKSESE